MMGYAGMLFAHHAGLRAIADVAVLGLVCCWLTGVVLMPGLLRLRELQLKRRLPLALMLDKPAEVEV
jgi:hypothetical protein